MGFGEKCTRCGKCCKTIPCGIGLALLGDHRPCLALEKGEDGRFSCGLVLHASKYVDLGESTEWKDEFLGRMFAHMLGIGAGCCSDFETDLKYEAFVRKHKGKKPVLNLHD